MPGIAPSRQDLASNFDTVSSLHAGAELAMAAASCVPRAALQAGAVAPLFALPQAGRQGQPAIVALDALLAAGPVVLHFFRGTWCDDGARSLADFAAAGPQLTALGASPVAIGPGGLARRRHAHAGALLELHDADLRVARDYGLAFNLPGSLRPRYRRLGYRPPDDLDAPGSWLVPVPAVYLLDRDGVVVLASIELDYRKRFDAAPLLRALHTLSPVKREYRAR